MTATAPRLKRREPFLFAGTSNYINSVEKDLVATDSTLMIMRDHLIDSMLAGTGRLTQNHSEEIYT